MAQSQLFTMPSGATLAVTTAPFADAWALTKASLRTVKGMDLKSGDLDLDFSELLKTPAALALIIDRIVDFATSPEVEAAFWKCASRALYIPAGSPPEFPGEKMDQRLFDHPEHANAAREDYAKILASVLEVNCKPFLVKALSGLMSPKAGTKPGSQTSK